MPRIIVLLCAVATVVATACGGSSEPFTLPTTDLDVGGSFALELAAGQPLPVLAGLTETQEVDLVADTLVISPPNQWVETSYFQLTAFTDGSATTTTSVSNGTYAIGNGAITFTMVSPGAQTFTGSVSGKTLSLLYNGATYIYSRP